MSKQIIFYYNNILFIYYPRPQPCLRHIHTSYQSLHKTINTVIVSKI